VAGTEKATASALVDIGYQQSANHSIELAFVHAHTGEDEAAYYHTSMSESDSYNDRLDRRLRFVERALSFGQLLGDHTLPAAGNLHVRWQAHVSRPPPAAQE